MWDIPSSAIAATRNRDGVTSAEWKFVGGVGGGTAVTTRKPSPRHDDPHTGTCFYFCCTPANNRASTLSRSAGQSRSSHVAVPDSRERHKGKASGVLDADWTSAPLLCLRPNGRHRPAGRSPNPGRPKPPSAVLSCEFGLSQGPLAWLGWLHKRASLLSIPGNHNCLTSLVVATIKQTSCFSGFSYGLYPLTLQAGTMGGQGQGYV